MNHVLRLMELREELQKALAAVDRAIVVAKRVADEVSLDELDLTVRERNALTNMDITSVSQLVQARSQEMLRTPNFGQISLRRVKAELARFGLALAA